MKRWEELFTDWNRAMEQGIGVGRLLADIAVEHAKLEAVASAARVVAEYFEADYSVPDEVVKLNKALKAL